MTATVMTRRKRQIASEEESSPFPLNCRCCRCHYGIYYQSCPLIHRQSSKIQNSQPFLRMQQFWSNRRGLGRCYRWDFFRRPAKTSYTCCDACRTTHSAEKNDNTTCRRQGPFGCRRHRRRYTSKDMVICCFVFSFRSSTFDFSLLTSCRFCSVSCCCWRRAAVELLSYFPPSVRISIP